jgi:hypothetical protein
VYSRCTRRADSAVLTSAAAANTKQSDLQGTRYLNPLYRVREVSQNIAANKRRIRVCTSQVVLRVQGTDTFDH